MSQLRDEGPAIGGEHGTPWNEDGLQALGSVRPPATRAEVCVVGAGVAGLTTACLLAQAGKHVVVVDARQLGRGETGLSTAHLASALDDRFQTLERTHGRAATRLAVESHAMAIDWIERLALTEEHGCGFRRVDGWLFLDAKHGPRELLRERAAALRAGVDVEWADRLPVPTLSAGPALRFRNQAQVDPAAYLAALARYARDLGVEIHVGVRAEEFEGGPTTRTTLADGTVITAGALVVATNTPVHERVRLHTKQHAYRSYAVALEVPTGSVPTALYWDTADPYHYVRLAASPGAELLVVGGEDHRTGVDARADDRWRRLVLWARERFPQVGEVRKRWSGQVLEPDDGLAFIGRSPDRAKNVYLATGDSGHGMTHGTIAGLLLSDLIRGRENPWERLYDPRRFKLRGLGSWLSENAVTAEHYLDWVAPAPVKTVEAIAPGDGAVLRRGGRRLAVHRDESGDLHVLSAKCPHLGGMVTWNPAEKSWDCPCHGSRFDAKGCVLNGPAHEGLDTVDPSLLGPTIAPPVAPAEAPVEAPPRRHHPTFKE